MSRGEELLAESRRQSAAQERIAEAIEALGVELYRIRVAVEVMAGDVLDRSPLGGFPERGS